MASIYIYYKEIDNFFYFILKIQKRTQKVKDAIEKEWYERWWQFILDNHEKPWDWADISRNPNLTMKFINANPDKPWNWHWISWNPGIKQWILLYITRTTSALIFVV